MPFNKDVIIKDVKDVIKDNKYCRKCNARNNTLEEN